MKRRAWFAQIKPLLWLTIVTSAFLTEQTTKTLDVVVTSENDSGPGTLRQAIIDTNGDPGPNNITFAPNINTISLVSPLPQVNTPLTIDGFNSAIDCNQLSPTNSPEEFSATITVTIDGSKIPTTGPSPLVGILLCASDCVVRGLRIAHFSNTEDALVAGIAAEGSNTLIECCEVTDLNGNFSPNNTTVSGICEIDSANQATMTISKCFIHNLSTINRTATNTVTNTGSIVGIGGFKHACNSRIENLTSGSIIHTNAFPGSNSTTLENGNVTGISTLSGIGTLCEYKSRQCSNSHQEENSIYIDNCLVNCCKTGSIIATKSASIFANSATGISITGASKAFVTENYIANILSGTVLLSEETFSFNSLFGAVGILTQASAATLKDNTVTTVTRGAISIGGMNSSAITPIIAGIFSESNDVITAENNTVYNIKSLPLSAFGVCTTMQNFENEPVGGPCIGNFANPIDIKVPICTGILLTGSTLIAHNNTIANIDGGKSIATGDRALLVNGPTNGIFITSTSSDFLDKISVEENHINNILGAKLITKFPARGIFGGNGTRGINIIVAASNDNTLITTSKNRIENIHEQTLSAEPSTTGGYIFPKAENANLKRVAKQSAKTAAISTTISRNFPIENIIIVDNIISEVEGATVQKKDAGTGTIAIGINVENLIEEGVGSTGVNLSTCSSRPTTPPRIDNNYITDIKGGTNNAAYGIMLDGTLNTLFALENSTNPLPSFFAIQNNTISNIVGFGIPQPFEAPLFSLNNCGSNQEENVTFIPFPYQPTSAIYTLFEQCTTIAHNTISNTTEPNKNARGITIQASNNIDITDNIISKINGYGIFVGGSTVTSSLVGSNGLITEEQFENLFTSNRNTIFSNSTFDNVKQGIKLGLIDWNDYFDVSEIQCGGSNSSQLDDGSIDFEDISIIGNHGQLAPHICNIKKNSNSTITATFVFDSPDQPCTAFIIQFFRNKTNKIPHGKQAISNFNDPACRFKTDINGHAKKTITFTPLALIETNDLFSAHVTVAPTGQSTTTPSNTKGDTSEFGIEIKENSCPKTLTSSSASNQKTGWLSFLGKSRPKN